MNAPANNSIIFAHVAQVIHKLPHRGVCYFYLIDVHCQEGESRAPEQIRHVSGIYSVLDITM